MARRTINAAVATYGVLTYATNARTTTLLWPATNRYRRVVCRASPKTLWAALAGRRACFIVIAHGAWAAGRGNTCTPHASFTFAASGLARAHDFVAEFVAEIVHDQSTTNAS